MTLDTFLLRFREVLHYKVKIGTETPNCNRKNSSNTYSVSYTPDHIKYTLNRQRN